MFAKIEYFSHAEEKTSHYLFFSILYKSLINRKINSEENIIFLHLQKHSLITKNQ